MQMKSFNKKKLLVKWNKILPEAIDEIISNNQLGDSYKTMLLVIFSVS